MAIIILCSKADPRKRDSEVHLKELKKDNNEMSKQIGTKMDDKIQTQFSYEKNLVYSDHHESVNCPIGVENQGTNVCFVNSVMKIVFSLSSFQNYIEQSSHDD